MKNMSLADYFSRSYRLVENKDLSNFQIRPIVIGKEDDFFIYGNIKSDKTEWVREHLDFYNAKRYICFASNEISPDEAYQFDHRTVIVQESLLITEEIVSSLVKLLQESTLAGELCVTIDLSSLEREFILLLATVLFKLENPPKIRFIYLSPEKYDFDYWTGLDQEDAEVLLIAPGVPVFGDSILFVIAGYEVKAFDKFIYKFKPHKVIIGQNKVGTSPEAGYLNQIAVRKTRGRIGSEADKLDQKAITGIQGQLASYKEEADRFNLTVREYTKEKSEELVSEYRHEKGVDVVLCDVKNPIICCKDIYDTLRWHIFPDANIKLASTNTRLSIIGVALFAAQKHLQSKVQLVYARPKDFVESKSASGFKDYYEYTFEPNHLDLLDMIRGVDF